MKNYYDVLGVPKNAAQDQIKDAYRKLVLKYHPDVNKDPKTVAKMQEVNEAYAVLGDQQKRQQYDMFGPEQFGQKFSEQDIFRGFNFQDIFRDLGLNMNFGFSGDDVFGDMFSGGARQQQQSGVNLYLSLDELEKGVEKEFEVEHYKTCNACRGGGGEPGSKQIKCSACNGAGRRTVRQNTPFGVFQMTTTCDKCGGKGKLHERICRTCNGNGSIVVRERFKVRAGKSDTDSEPKKRFWVF